MSAPTEDEVQALEDALDIETIRVRVEIGDKIYGVTHALPKGWPTRSADEDGAVTVVAAALGGVAFQSIVQHFAPHLVDGATAIPELSTPESSE